MLDHTGIDGSFQRTPAALADSASLADATTGLWNAQATGSLRAVMPAALRAATTASTSAVGPATTVWRGPLLLATTTAGCSARWRARSASLAAAAAIAPGSAAVAAAAWMAAAPRLAERQQAPGSTAPADAQGDQLAVAVAGGDVGPHPHRPSRSAMARPATPRAGWATRVSVRAAAWASRPALVKARAG